jgi:hypothetical protein
VTDGEPLAPLVAAICDGEEIDWAAARAAARNDADREMLRHLETIAAVSSGRHRPPMSRRAVWPSVARAASAVILALASGKTILALAWCVTALVLPERHAGPPWPFVASLLVFGMAGWVLLWGGGRDLRVPQLGALFVVIASSYSDTVPVGHETWRVAWWPAAALQGITTDAFLAFALWMFVSVFPAKASRSMDRLVGQSFAVVSLAVGVCLLAANLTLRLPTLAGALPPGTLSLLQAADRYAPERGYYWLTVFGLAAPALPYLLWRSRFGGCEDRRRVAFFTGSLVAGLAPMLAAVLLSRFLPFFDDPGRRQRVGVLLYAALLAMVPATAYSVFVHRVLDVGLVVRRALQYRIARYAIWATTAAPLVALGVYVHERRHMAIAEIIDWERSLTLAPAVAAGALVLASRRRLLALLDRIFLREPPNHLQVMATLEQRLREASSAREIAEIAALEIDRATHPQSIAVLLADRTGQRLVPVEDGARPLELGTPLGALLLGVRQEIQIGRASSPIWDLLPDGDREWLESGGFVLLIPLVDRAGRLVGAVAQGETRSELPYSREDRLLLRVMAAEAANAIENCRLRHLPGRPASATPETLEAHEEPAAQCPECRLVWPTSRRDCQCGARTQRAALPAFLLAKFRLERLLGSGGMGLVYLAVDLSLDRRVAIKTLIRLSVEKARRLEREARAMARVRHPNLAVIFGVERWDEYPLLIVEYLEGGTLADRLRQSRMTPREALSLGVVLGDVLDRVHASGMLHRDIKPSNIGYSAEGVPKLLDFGLASLVSDAAGTPAGDLALPATDGQLPTSTTATSSHHLKGTVPYLSPEAVGGAAPDVSFDLWSLGLVLYESVAGINPLAASGRSATFENIRSAKVPDVRVFCPDCPPLVARFFLDALAASRDVRPPTAAALRGQCQRLLAQLPGHGR